MCDEFHDVCPKCVGCGGTSSAMHKPLPSVMVRFGLIFSLFLANYPTFCMGTSDDYEENDQWLAKKCNKMKLMKTILEKEMSQNITCTKFTQPIEINLYIDNYM